MLELKNIEKDYPLGDDCVNALRKVNLNFADSEFVSILGPSGCGKTTLLNIIGGLDHYTRGDLLIDGKSTKDFTESEWDAYRNSCVGFVFQSYNLIPHLSVLGNVEIALTLSGIGASERKERALSALDKVGLTEQANKRPNQLSGGQMQRVAIARALVCNPKIILADEPTGALDSKTSEQVMELLKEIAHEKLIVMVTHNADLAEKYSTRIVKLLDGEIISDESRNEQIVNTEKVSDKETEKETEKDAKPHTDKAKFKRTAMSFFTALSLSLKNLFTKKGRTFITSFAGSIGIIGVALVLAISNGFTMYINNLQSGSLAGYPITITRQNLDIQSMMTVDRDSSEREEYPDVEEIFVYNSSAQMSAFMNFNIIDSDYIAYVDELKEKKDDRGNKIVNDIQYSFSSQMKFLNSTGSLVDSGSLMQELMGNNEFIQQQYQIIYGDYPTEPQDGVHQAVFVVNEYNRVNTNVLDMLGIPYTQSGDGYENVSFSKIVGTQFKLLANDVYYTKAGEGDDIYFDKLQSSAYANAYDDDRNFTVEIVGVMRIRDTAPMAIYDTGVCYLPSLTQAYLTQCRSSEIGDAQQKSTRDAYITLSPLASSGKVTYTDIINYFKMTYGKQISESEAKEYALQQVGASFVPDSIYIYPKDFAAKSIITEHLDRYNEGKEDERKIYYSDLADILSSTMGEMIDIISYVLIAFGCVSLIVSSIMIGVITYASVIERTREIGVLRSLGARKKDIARVFNAETVIIGFVAGVIGVGVSFLLCFPVNSIILGVSGGVVSGSLAVLNPLHAVMLIGISMLLTLIGGLVPSSIAAKKDPVVALRTE